jgi:hypothetical protein
VANQSLNLLQANEDEKHKADENYDDDDAD